MHEQEGFARSGAIPGESKRHEITVFRADDGRTDLGRVSQAAFFHTALIMSCVAVVEQTSVDGRRADCRGCATASKVRACSSRISALRRRAS